MYGGTLPFDYVPKVKFIRRMLAPAVFVYFIGFLTMGTLTTTEYFEKIATQPCPAFPPPYVIHEAPLPAARLHHELIYKYIVGYPQPCQTGEYVSEFQGRQCKIYFQRLMMLGALGLLPFALAGLFLLVTLDLIAIKYRRARGIVAEGKVLSRGTVTDPPDAPNDMFGWWYCLRSIAVQLANGHQVRIYIPGDLPSPLSGETFNVYQWGESFGAMRYFGMLHAPHMAVIGGRD